MIQAFYCTNSREYTNIPSCSGKLGFDSSRLQEGIFVYKIVKLYNKANLSLKFRRKYQLSVLKMSSIRYPLGLMVLNISYLNNFGPNISSSFRYPFSLKVLDISYLNPYTHNVLFVRHRQTVQTQLRGRKTRGLTGSPLFAYRKFCLTLNKMKKYYPPTLKTEMDWSN